jgi:hypothetical protein
MAGPGIVHAARHHVAVPPIAEAPAVAEDMETASVTRFGITIGCLVCVRVVEIDASFVAHTCMIEAVHLDVSAVEISVKPRG